MSYCGGNLRFFYSKNEKLRKAINIFFHEVVLFCHFLIMKSEALAMMVNSSTNINKTKNHLSPQPAEHKIVGSLGPDLVQAQQMWQG